MDLARMIADASYTLYKKECEKNMCSLKINMHCKYSYELNFIPLTRHILIKYKTIEYKINRSDKESYESIVDFLIKAIKEDAAQSVNNDIELESYWPESDEYYDVNSIKVLKDDTQVFYKNFSEENMEKDIKCYMNFMRFLN